MTTQILSGQAAIEAGSEAEFSGMVSPRRYRCSESLMDRAATLLDNAFRGRWGATQKLAEAFSTSDFTLGAFATIDRQMLANYDELPAVWQSYTTRTTVNDFRPTYLLDRWRNTVGFEKVPELTEYPAEDSRGNANYTIQVAKWGRRFAISWESWINNDAIQELEDLPAVLARQARETETINALNNLLLADGSNVNTNFFKAGNNNAPAAVPLTLENLDAALGAMAAKKSAMSGRVVASPDLVLVVPKALERQALRIKAIREIRTTTGANEVVYDNYVSTIDVVVEPMLDYYNKHAKAATTWFLVPKPGQGRPALWAAYLRGHEQPDLRVKAGGGQRVGGGEVSPLDGGFEVDDIQYRGRMIVGNQVGDPTFAYVSLGS